MRATYSYIKSGEIIATSHGSVTLKNVAKEGKSHEILYFRKILVVKYYNLARCNRIYKPAVLLSLQRAEP